MFHEMPWKKNFTVYPSLKSFTYFFTVLYDLFILLVDNHPLLPNVAVDRKDKSICCSFNSISSAKQKSHWTLKSNSPLSSIILSWWRFESSCKRMFSNVHGSIQVFWGMDMKTLTLLELSQLPKLSPLSSICSHIQKGLHSFSLQSRHTYQLLNS